jgi:hypothetical protein
LFEWTRLSLFQFIGNTFSTSVSLIHYDPTIHYKPDAARRSTLGHRHLGLAGQCVYGRVYAGGLS